MKRVTRIGSAMLIACAMLFIMAGTAFAAEGQATPEATKDAALLQGKDIVEPGPVTDEGLDAYLNEKAQEVAAQRADGTKQDGEAALSAASDDPLTVYRLTQYKDIWSSYPDSLYSTYNSSRGYYTADSQWVYINRGMFYLYGYSNASGVALGLVNEDGNLVKSFSMSTSYKDYSSGIWIPKTGYYYVLAVGNNSFTTRLKATSAPIFDYRATFLTNNRAYYSGHPTKAITITYKFKAVATGAMRIEKDVPARITVTNTSGRVLGYSLNGKYEPTYGVKKGQIYMIKIAWPESSNDAYAQGTNRIRVVNATWASVAGSSKYYAKTLPQNAYRKGLIIAGQNNVGWFKFRPHKRNFKITFAAGTNDKLVWRVYCNNKHVSSRVFYQYLSWQSANFYGPSDATWYVKVERVNSNSSGRYQVRFQ